MCPNSSEIAPRSRTLEQVHEDLSCVRSELADLKLRLEDLASADISLDVNVNLCREQVRTIQMQLATLLERTAVTEPKP